MLNIIEVKGQATATADYNSKQGTVATIESGTAANSANFRMSILYASASMEVRGTLNEILTGR